jgi:fructose-bisphosphate aldolase class I
MCHVHNYLEFAMDARDKLGSTIARMVRDGAGVLAADESAPTIAKRFSAIGVESTVETRRDYRSLILSTPELQNFISAVILFEETLTQRADDGTPLPEFIARQGIVPGIKVDKGKIPLANAPGEEITEGLDGLAARLRAYEQHGARFAKWRDVYHITGATPSRLAIETNAEVLARYAAICQSEGIVPIVEPEVLIDGEHGIERAAEVSEAVLREVFQALSRHRVELETILLKPSMVVPGKSHANPASPEAVAEATIRIFRRVVPAAVPSINFLSGGQSPEQATANLNALNNAGSVPWALSFSYGRALQEPALKTWHGQAANGERAQAALYKRARLNGAACRGEYNPALENT